MDKIINRLKQGERLLQASCEFGFNYYIRYSENVFFFEKWKRNLETEQEVLCNVECINENTVRCALRAR